MGGWMVWWVGKGLESCQITKNLINRNLIEIIQFFLKIFDLWSHPSYGWVYWWLCGWTFWHFSTFYLNHLSPLQSYFWFVGHPTYGWVYGWLCVIQHWCAKLRKRMTLVYNNITCLCVLTGVQVWGARGLLNLSKTAPNILPPWVHIYNLVQKYPPGTSEIGFENWKWTHTHTHTYIYCQYVGHTSTSIFSIHIDFCHTKSTISTDSIIIITSLLMKYD